MNIYQKRMDTKECPQTFLQDYDPYRDCNLCGVKTEMGFAWAEIDDRKSGGRKNGRITVCSGKLCV